MGGMDRVLWPPWDEQATARRMLQGGRRRWKVPGVETPG
jgi:hypothetical protein